MAKKGFRVPPWLDSLFLAIGLGMLVWVVSRYPLKDLLDACVRLGPAVALTPIIAVGWIACNTSALHLLVDKQIPWPQLLRIRLIGDGYNALLPLAGLGGEPFKVKHMSRWVPADQLLAALIRDRVMENAMGLVFISTWLLLAVTHFTFPPSFRFALLIFVPIAAAVGVVTALLVITTLPSKAGAAIARALGLTQAGMKPMPLSQFARVLGWYLAARFVGTLELTLLFHLLGLGFDPLTIAFSYSLLNAAGYIGFAIPQGLGVFEGTTVFLFSLLGFPGALAVAVALARRARMLIVGLLGVLLHLTSSTPVPLRNDSESPAQSE